MKWNVCPKSGGCQQIHYEETSGILVELQPIKLAWFINCLIGSGMVRTHMAELYKCVCINYFVAVIKHHDIGMILVHGLLLFLLFGSFGGPTTPFPHKHTEAYSFL